MSLYIKVGSITNAQRARAILQKNSVKASVQRIENPKPGDGCGYALRTENSNKNPVRILESSGIRVLGVEENDIP